ncbi:MAG: GDSL-type esterase/lipase family protein [Planctomycetota bacterium]|jgi:lysophospholipase L1-like esterase
MWKFVARTVYARTVNAAAALLLFALAAAGAQTVNPSDYEGKIRVACVGDSITFGAGVRNRGQNSYPAQLGRMLGEKWEVRNFGRSGATLLKKGNLPYWKQGQYRAALGFKPHVVVIKLGTNDSKPGNWRHKGEYAGDYVALVRSFQDLPSSPKVWLCYPVPAYPGRWGITDRVMKNEVIPLLDEVARRTGLPIIDLYAALSGKKHMFPDTVHPNAAGAKVMAETIHAVLTARGEADKTERFEAISPDVMAKITAAMKTRGIPKEMEVDFALVWAGVEKAWPGRGSKVKKRDDRLLLDLRRVRVSDLSPLRGLPIGELHLAGTQVSDLTPIGRLPLKRLHIELTKVTDLGPIRGLKLETLNAGGQRGLTDISPLRDMPISWLALNGTGVSDLSPLRNMKTLKDIYIRGAKVTDLSPLEGMDVRIHR